MAIQKKDFAGKLEAVQGQTVRALVEGESKDNPLVWEARLEGMAPEIDGKVYLTDVELPGGEIAATGDMVRVEIQKTDSYDLVGALWIEARHLCSSSCAGSPKHLRGLRRARRSA